MPLADAAEAPAWTSGGDYTSILYETLGPVARISHHRPQARNAQNTPLLDELDAAMKRAVADEAIRVIIIAGTGDHFSAGHDLKEAINERGHYTVEQRWEYEATRYYGYAMNIWDAPKPTIAQVQGKCIAGGLMLAWPCDLIVAAHDAAFCDNTVGMGVGGVEYFAHPWELGPRKAKELLFTADWLTAQEAKALGMVNHVVPAAELAQFTLDLARRIAAKPMFALRLAKEAVNAAEDAQGRVGAMNTAFALHQLAHSHNMQVHGMPVDPGGLQVRRKTEA